jgi:hypothetical protein
MVTGGEFLVERAALRAIVRAESLVTGVSLGRWAAGDGEFSTSRRHVTLTQLSQNRQSI